MPQDVQLETVTPVTVAAVRARVRIPEIASAWKPALDQVWAFLRARPEIRPGHNLFLYHHPANREDPIDVDFGVEVSQRFEPEGAVRCIDTPAGETATTLLIGPYSKMPAAHQALHDWCRQNNKQIGAASWERYGDWEQDETKLKTWIYYVLR